MFIHVLKYLYYFASNISRYMFLYKDLLIELKL